MTLTPKQEAFCQAFIETGNASAAYRRAYNASRMKSDVITVKASELLSSGNVAVRVAELRHSLAERCDASNEKVIREVAALAFSDIRKLFNDDGTVKHVSELDDMTAAAIAAIDVSEICGSDGTVIGFVKKIKLWDKNSAQERLCKHLGLFERDNKQKTDPIQELLKQIGGSLPVKP